MRLLQRGVNSARGHGAGWDTDLGTGIPASRQTIAFQLHRCYLVVRASEVQQVVDITSASSSSPQIGARRPSQAEIRRLPVCKQGGLWLLPTARRRMMLKLATIRYSSTVRRVRPNLQRIFCEPHADPCLRGLCRWAPGRRRVSDAEMPVEADSHIHTRCNTSVFKPERPNRFASGPACRLNGQGKLVDALGLVSMPSSSTQSVRQRTTRWRLPILPRTIFCLVEGIRNCRCLLLTRRRPLCAEITEPLWIVTVPKAILLGAA
jgi:hypothetical protein